MKKKDISKKSIKELREDVASALTKARETRFGAASAQSKNTKFLLNNRRSVARMKTAIRAQEKAATK